MGMRWIDHVNAVPQRPPQRNTVMLSAGHSDTVPGIVANGYKEADIVQLFRDDVSVRLASLGIRHVLDGEPGENLPLRQAVRIAQGCDISIEFHTNGGGPGATGVETLSRAHNKPLGAQLCRVTADLLGIANRGAKPEDAGYHERLAFVSGGGGLIFELFFLSNANDLYQFKQHYDEFVDAVAGVIADAARAA
ncbi:N-acetylmuramoyl-L-alanine amidase [Halomonas sp. KG2]|uniref:N-acetylmuramoyl-L-alanine amidase n=1 Tax=Halomonas sp. KG2 TaxID=2951138 RepID=UPI0026496468|nr:N-acetylmuramoyl-L-alanine amidase [Halomonas sp. KG2]WKD26603.1 N-acetylmuramoyl-L-alanine amidase [Halomonas sp. KG2]